MNLVGDVLFLTVRKVSSYQDLMGTLSVQQPLFRKNSDLFDIWLVVFVTVGCPSSDPIQDGLVIRGIDGETFSPFVVHTEGGLL